MSQALYRKYRSKSLDEIVGQSHITDMLRRAIASGRVSHAYLLTGPRGVGKTSIARILAHEINHLPYTDESSHLDIIEIDAASHTSVEDVRDLRDKVQIAPTSADKKVYIIDEVHMLSKSAFNALLKTLEEPPAHVIFILATTDADKLPATILSRVQRFNFRAISPEDVVEHLRYIAKSENITIDDAALGIIALHGRGSFRDSISLLDQLSNLSDGNISADLVERVLGLAEGDTIQQLLDAYRIGDIATIVARIDHAETHGTPAPLLAEQLISAIRKHVVEQPELLNLLDKLTDVARSPWPQVKLLTALTSGVTPVAVARPVSLPSAQKPVEQKTESPKPTPKPTKPLTKKAPEPENTLEESASTPTTEAAPQTVAPSASVAFAWDEFLAAVKEKATGAHSLLQKAGYDFDGEMLTIHAGKKFAKTQLDKALPSLSSALQEIGQTNATVNVLPTPKPPADGQTAAILAIMGGGEEVKING